MVDIAKCLVIYTCAMTYKYMLVFTYKEVDEVIVDVHEESAVRLLQRQSSRGERVDGEDDQPQRHTSVGCFQRLLILEADVLYA